VCQQPGTLPELRACVWCSVEPPAQSSSNQNLTRGSTLQLEGVNVFPIMERKLKEIPPRLPVIFQRFDAPLYFVTFNTLLERPLPANDSVHSAFRRKIQT
jgi:hypothetical protein